jgi:hypothetical protein
MAQDKTSHIIAGINQIRSPNNTDIREGFQLLTERTEYVIIQKLKNVEKFTDLGYQS